MIWEGHKIPSGIRDKLAISSSVPSCVFILLVLLSFVFKSFLAFSFSFFGLGLCVALVSAPPCHISKTDMPPIATLNCNLVEAAVAPPNS